MNWYKTFKTILAAYTNAKDEIEELHKFELQSYLIDTLPELSNVNPKRKENVKERIREEGWTHFVPCKEHIEYIFETWQNSHRIKDADDFTEMIIDEFREMGYGTDEKILEQALHFGIKRGYTTLTPDVMKEYIDKERVQSLVSDDFRSDYEAYNYQIEDYLNKNYPEWEDENLSAEEYMTSHRLENEVEEYILKNIDYDSELYGFEMSDLENAIKEVLYRDYIIELGGSIETVHEEIDSALERLNNVTENDDINTMTGAISLALNVMHVHGNIMKDYNGEITPDFLEGLGNHNVDDSLKQSVLEMFFG